MYWSDSTYGTYSDTNLRGHTFNVSTGISPSIYTQIVVVETNFHAYSEPETDEARELRRALRRRPLIDLELRASRAPVRPRAPVAKLAPKGVAWPVAIAAYRGRSSTQKASRRLDSRAIG